MQIKTTLGVLHSNLKKVVEVSRQEMEYGCHIETSGGFFSRVEKRTPMEEFTGVFNAVELFHPDTEVLISCEAAGKMNILLKKGGYK